MNDGDVGVFCGADVSVSEIVFNNLIPVVAGNAVGASVCVGYVHWHAFGLTSKHVR